MAGTPFDVIIVGQGIAGTVLAWHLRDAGQCVLVLDTGPPVSSSAIAAGLITPVTGQRLVLDPNFDEQIDTARSYYRAVEREAGRSFFHDRTAIRLFRSGAERQAWAKRVAAADYRAHLIDPQPDPLIEPEIADAGEGGFAMQAAQLDVAAFLDAARAALATERLAVDWQRDVTFQADTVTVGSFAARRIVSCEGHAAAANPHFAGLSFNPVKGDILTIRTARPLPPRIVHRGIWIAPTTEPDIFRVGATYERKTLGEGPTPAARAELEGALQDFFRVPYEIVDHQAAVRPAISGTGVMAGLHPREPRLGFLNGLGSKGALLAPFHARCLAEHIVHGAPLPEAVDLRRHLSP
ncbi:MAG TPA: FAD-dependent oxidoreductase [Afifellaceae bacterium]|nr:FAD-dependent oxidoreductase [Afifellaceae bacterium]